MDTEDNRSLFARKKADLGELAERIHILYNPPREYFTILIPVLIALLLVIGAAMSGMVFKGTEKVQAADSDKLKAYQELMAQMNADDGEDTLSTDTTKTEEKKPDQRMGLDEVLIFAVIIAITPYAIDITLQKRTIRRKEELYTEFLFKLSELMRGGLDPIKSVKELSRTDLGILSPNVRIASTSMVYGKSFGDSMKSMAKSLQSELISRYTTLVIQASYSGGSVADLILKASEDMRSIIGIEREKEGNLSQYVMIFYFAQGIIFFIILTLTTSLLPFIDQLGPSSPFGVNKLAGVDFARGFFHLIMVNAFFGGLIIGKIAEGDARHGLKHAAILMMAGYIACAVFIIPPPVAETTGDFSIEVISGNAQEGFPMLPLKDPIMFKLIDKEGNAVNRTEVQFTIMPGGSVSPASDITNNDGVVSVDVKLGENTGNYMVIASSNGVTQRATAISKNA
ncbi:MAG: type II secretion system F family protein [Methanoregula sp.]|jgi:flagellar protein FlaJ|nr:type II secretion system F family protein [Methanoregula sp.]